jgi:hypothetical protein
MHQRTCFLITLRQHFSSNYLIYICHIPSWVSFGYRLQPDGSRRRLQRYLIAWCKWLQPDIISLWYSEIWTQCIASFLNFYCLKSEKEPGWPGSPLPVLQLFQGAQQATTRIFLHSLVTSYIYGVSPKGLALKKQWSKTVLPAAGSLLMQCTGVVCEYFGIPPMFY